MIGDKFTVNNTEYVIKTDTNKQMYMVVDFLNQTLGLEQKELDKLSLYDAITIFQKALLILKNEIRRGKMVIR